MSSQNLCESPVQSRDGSGGMTETEAIRAVYPTHTMKRLAAALDVPLDTARQYLYRGMPASRLGELAAVLQGEIAAERARTDNRLRHAELWIAGRLAGFAARK